MNIVVSIILIIFKVMASSGLHTSSKLSKIFRPSICLAQQAMFSLTRKPLPTVAASSDDMFCVPTRSGAFHYMMQDLLVRNNFIESFIPKEKVVTSKVIPTYPELGCSISKYDLRTPVSDILHDIIYADKFDRILDQDFKLVVTMEDFVSCLHALPMKPSPADTLCYFEYTNSKNHTKLVEVQIVHDYFDITSMFRANAVLSRHLDSAVFEADRFEEIVSIYLLADRTQTLQFNERDTVERVSHYIPSLLRYRYPIFQMQNSTLIDQNWIKLLISAQEQKSDILSSTLHPAILRAYEMLKINSLPTEYRDWYITQDWPTQSFVP